MISRNGLAFALLSLLALVISPGAPTPVSRAADKPGAHGEDWPFWRGPRQNGVSPDRDLPDKIVLSSTAADANVLWRTRVGGITTPIIQNGRVYVITKTGEPSIRSGKPSAKPGEGVYQQERVVCFNADTGKQLWEHKFNVFLTDVVRDRLGWSQMVGDPATGNVYAHGTQGFLLCFDKDGKILWRHSLTEEYGRVSGYGGRIVSPIVDGDLLIQGMANASWGANAIGGTRFVAFNKHTGAVVWWASTGYRIRNTFACTPIVAVINGERLLLSGGGDGGLHAFKVKTGEKVWSYIFGTGAVNCSPVVQGSLVFCGNAGTVGGGLQGRVICVDAAQVADGKPKLVWKVDGIKARYASPLLHQGKLYVCDDVGGMYCLDAKTGDELWKHQFGNNTRGSPVWADGKIYIPELDGKFHVLKPGPKGCEDTPTRIRPPRGKFVPVELVGSPSIANGRIYFMTNYETICIGKKSATPKIGKLPPRLPLPKPPAGTKATHLQIVPADVTLYPGDSVEFKVRSFDAHGRLLGEVKANWSLAGMLPPIRPIGMPKPPPPKTKPTPAPALKGTLSAASGETTKLTVAKTMPAQFGRVVAKANGLTASARVRVAPTLPYAPDFAKVPVGRTPPAWINCQGKFLVAEIGGKHVLKKRNDNPGALVAQSYTFMGMPSQTNYTIAADVQGTQVGKNLPDLGIVGCRYTLMMMGNEQKMRIVSWEAEPPNGRIDKTIKWDWKPGVWYRMKLNVMVEGDKAILRGKVWERGKDEPGDWTLELTDPCPNRSGSPGLYGYATGVVSGMEPGATVYYDNVKVTPNK